MDVSYDAQNHNHFLYEYEYIICPFITCVWILLLNEYFFISMSNIKINDKLDKIE